MNARIFVIPGFLAVFSLVVIWAALRLELSPPMIVGEGMQPRAFPIFLMILNLGLIGLMTLQAVRNPPKPVPIEAYPTWGTMALLILFYGLTVTTDMFIGIAVVMFLMCLLWGERRMYVALSVALLTPALIFALFDFVLRIRFPRGVLTNLYYG